MGDRVLGPGFSPVTRVQSLHIKKIVLKIEISANISPVRKLLEAVQHEMQMNSAYKQLWCILMLIQHNGLFMKLKWVTCLYLLKVCIRMKQEKFRLLFVCLGNICRSPSAEGVMKKLVKRVRFRT